MFSVVIQPNCTGHTAQRAWKDVPSEQACRSKNLHYKCRDSVDDNNINLQQLPTSNFIETSAGDGGNRRRRRDDASEFMVQFACTKRACCLLAFQLNTCDINTCRAAVQAKMSLTAAEVNTGFTNAQITSRIRTVGS